MAGTTLSSKRNITYFAHMYVINLAALPAAELADLRREVEPLRNLGDLLDWTRGRQPAVLSPQVVTQDEYTHDVIIPYGTNRYLDFDTT
jgi:hypothetical protein